MYKRSRELSSFNIAGFSHWDGAQAIDKLKINTKLKMVAEFDNPYDSNAIALYYKKIKLGYVPHDLCGLFAPYLAFGHGAIFEVRVTQVDKFKSPQHQVRVQIRLQDAK